MRHALVNNLLAGYGPSLNRGEAPAGPIACLIGTTFEEARYFGFVMSVRGMSAGDTRLAGFVVVR